MPDNVRIGAHVSAAGGISNAVDRVVAIGGNCLQLFVSSPRGWQKTNIAHEEVARFREKAAAQDVSPIFIHGLYLANIATDQAELREKSIDALAYALSVADRIGAMGVMYHTGSRKDQAPDVAMTAVVDSMKEILTRAPGASKLLIEGSAPQTGKVGVSFEELGEMIRRVGSDRVGVCLDTCHTVQAGYNLRTPEAIATTLKQFDQLIGLDRLVVLHANDAKPSPPAALDRHANIGDGAIGLEGFRAMLHNPTLRSLPWILEVPGFDGEGPDAKNVEIMRQLAE